MLKRCLLGTTKAASRLGIAVLLFYAGYAYPQTPHMPCQPLRSALAQIFGGGYAWYSTAITSNTAVIQVFINQRRDWIIIGIDHDQNACELLRGDNWMFPMENGI